MPFRNVAVVVNRGRPAAGETCELVTSYLQSAGIETTVVDAPLPDAPAGFPFLDGTELIITLGGDGTILAAGRLAAPYGIPILGVHLGRFGFIAEVHPENLIERLRDLLAGRYQVQERGMVEGEVQRGGVTVHSAMGLNDVVISRGAMTRMLQISTQIGEGPAMEYVADGVIVATPTGSTAYALSVGGPLMDPTLCALLVAPICPHTLAARPIVVPDTQEIRFLVETDGGEVKFTADSASVYSLLAGDVVLVRRSGYVTRLIVFHSASFYEKVHRRLLWGERLNE